MGGAGGALASRSCLVLLFVCCWLYGLVGCSKRPTGVYVDADSLRGVVAETQITEETGLSIRKAFARKDISAIELRDIDGGFMAGVARASPVFNERNILVRGDCMSACAILAVRGGRLELLNGVREARLFFHGMYSIEPNGRVLLSDLNNVMASLIHARFPFIPLNDIVRMTSYDNIDSGFLIKKDRFGEGYTFYDCNPLPECRVLRSLPLQFL
jgi:hypothetical protein